MPIGKVLTINDVNFLNFPCWDKQMQKGKIHSRQAADTITLRKLQVRYPILKEEKLTVVKAMGSEGLDEMFTKQWLINSAAIFLSNSAKVCRMWTAKDITVKPVDKKNWSDFETLFNQRAHQNIAGAWPGE